MTAFERFGTNVGAIQALVADLQQQVQASKRGWLGICERITAMASPCEARSVGIDRTALLKAMADPAMRQRLKDQTEAAIARGVFGPPFIFVDGQAFWGADRLPQVAAWSSGAAGEELA